jgi:hypothetical protein
MMRSFIRLLRRLLVLGIGAFSVWLIAFVIFPIADNRLPWILAAALTYGIAAYIVLPRTVRMSLKVLQREHVPRYTITGDGLPGDPVNLVLQGTRAQLDAGVRRRRMVTGRSADIGEFMAHGPHVSASTGSTRPCAPQHALFTAAARCRLQKAIIQPAEAPSRALLGVEPRAHRSDVGPGKLC